MGAALVKCANCGRRSSGTSRTRDAPAPRRGEAAISGRSSDQVNRLERDVLAEAVADHVDWHEIAALVHRGCRPRLALNIVL
jgi:hypothetical protein